MKKKLILIGAGGYAKSVIDSLDFDKYEIVGFIDDIKKGEHLGYKILGSSLDNFNSENYFFFVCIGDNEKRTIWYNKILEKDLEIINIIDKSAIVSKNIRIGKGIFIGKLAIVNSDVTLGNNIIINTKALLEHGTSVGDNSNVSTNTAVNGDTKIGKGCFIGSSSVLNGQLIIGDGAIIGSGTVVIRDVNENTTVVGVPGRVVKGE
ncbi:acetyltransferase [Fusobacterium massiliense]|uniref:acetyltransferase n=1 Tax=Fusobacterium massiliense TaxID=1852365 RepID=UPI0028D8F02A|nr:acetyltransferase [Fusobacterium massiliense]